jgi:hypothetical protein
MKNRLFTLFLIGLSLSGCQKDVEPDLTGTFVGAWRSFPVEDSFGTDISTMTIDRTAHNRVTVHVHTEFISKDRNVEPDGDFYYLFENVPISADGVMTITETDVDNGVVSTTILECTVNGDQMSGLGVTRDGNGRITDSVVMHFYKL